MSEDVVLYERRGHVALVTLNRPERRNALSPEVFSRLREVWDQFAADGEARVAVLTGAGDRAFCAGADLKVMNEGGGIQNFGRGSNRPLGRLDPGTNILNGKISRSLPSMMCTALVAFLSMIGRSARITTSSAWIAFEVSSILRSVVRSVETLTSSRE